MDQFIPKILESLQKVVKLPYLRQYILVLLLGGGLFVYLFIEGNKHQDSQQIILAKCQEDNIKYQQEIAKQAREFYEKVDSMRLEQIRQTENSNKEKEIALKSAQETTRILQKTIEKLKSK